MHIRTIVNLLFGLFGAGNAFTPSSGCGKSLASGIKTGGTGSSNTFTLTSGGRSRRYLVHIPTNYKINEARGLIFSFHGRGGWSSNQEALSGFSDPNFNADNLAVYPQGIRNQWQGDPAADTSINDVQFTLDMITAISNQFCINTDAIYVAGMSNGGGFSLNVLACDKTASKKIAAFASGSGAYYQPLASTGCVPGTVPISCHPDRQVPIFAIHGSADDVIPFYGGERRGRCLPSVNHFLQNWAYINGLGTTNVTTKVHGTGVHRHEFGHAVGKRGLVTSYWVYNLGHSWASTVANTDSRTPTFFNATREMMNWFNQYSLARTDRARQGTRHVESGNRTGRRERSASP